MNGQKEILCIVDDEPQVLKALSRELEDFCSGLNLELRTYKGPGACKKALAEDASRTAVLISDLRMAEQSGSDFLLEVHRDYPDIELMLLTAYNDIQEIQKAISATLRALITKPWNPEILEAEIENALSIRRMRQDNREYIHKLNRHLDIAADFQKNLLETRIPDVKNARLELSYMPHQALRIGGDYYDVIKLDDNRFIAMLGDVTGQGIRPSFVTAMLKVISLSLGSPRQGDQVTTGGLMTFMNKRLCQVLQNASDILITFSIILIDTEHMSLSISNAGHLPVYTINSGGVTEHKIEGPAMGFSSGVQYQQKDIPLKHGDAVAVYTDGLLETKSKQSKINSEVIKKFFRMAVMDEDFNETFLKQLKLVRGEEDFHDDVTLLSVRV
ncbi:PP2C family protein-serine/threonine phosphatase [Salinispira pacifica]|nr:SpoIIE family protein phosphatase [Salinispira pacifica]